MKIAVEVATRIVGAEATKIVGAEATKIVVVATKQEVEATMK